MKKLNHEGVFSNLAMFSPVDYFSTNNVQQYIYILHHKRIQIFFFFFSEAINVILKIFFLIYSTVMEIKFQ